MAVLVVRALCSLKSSDLYKIGFVMYNLSYVNHDRL